MLARKTLTENVVRSRSYNVRFETVVVYGGTKERAMKAIIGQKNIHCLFYWAKRGLYYSGDKFRITVTIRTRTNLETQAKHVELD